VLSFVFIYFSESGLFKGLQPIQIKKSSPSHSVRKNVSSRCPFAKLRAGANPATKNLVAQISYFANDYRLNCR